MQKITHIRLIASLLTIYFATSLLSSCSSDPLASTAPPSTISTVVENGERGNPLTTCQTVRDDAPKQVEYDSWDSPGVITTDVEIDKQGNKIIAGYMTDENDFNYKDSFQTVGTNGYGFTFIAKFNPQSEFQWIRCLRESSLNHWFKGPTINSDDKGNLYVCDSTLERWTPSGKLDWSSGALQWNSENSSDTTRNCATSSDGLTIVTGVDETFLVSPEGMILWKKDLGWNSTAEFVSDNLIALGSNSSMMVVNRKGELVWKHKRNQRDDLGPDGLTTSGISNSYPTDQTGLVAVENEVLIATTVNKKTDFDPSSKSLAFTPRWIQEIVVAKYSLSGKVRWAKKMEPPAINDSPNDIHYFEVFDLHLGKNGEIFVYGGGTTSREGISMRLFVAEFSPFGTQRGFMWLDEYTSFIHNMGRYIDVDSRGRIFGSGEGLQVPPFIWSRDL